MHAAVTYSNMGRSVCNEKAQLGLASRLFFTTYQVWLQAFFMGFLFFIAGYLVPPAFERERPHRLLRDRAVRLGNPLVVSMFLIGPATIYYLLGVRPGYSFREFFGHALNAVGPSIREGCAGPMWFCVALLIFGRYRGIRTIARRSAEERAWLPGNWARRSVHYRGRHGHDCWVHTVQPIGTAIWSIQLCFFAQYALLFIAASDAYRRAAL